MAIAFNMMDAVVRKSDIEKKYPGGLKQYMEDNAHKYVADEHLVLAGWAMDGHSLSLCVERLESIGLRFDPESPEKNEIYTHASFLGGGDRVDWIDQGEIDGCEVCWLKGTEPGEVIQMHDVMDRLRQEEEEREQAAEMKRQAQPVTTPLHDAAKTGDLAKLKKELSRGVDVDIHDREEHTPLQLAALGGQAKACQALIEAGADLEAPDQDGLRPLHLAAYHGHYEACRVLLEAGAEVSAEDHIGSTPLLKASGQHLEVCKLLLSQGASIDETNNYGNTGLIIATFRGNQELAEFLIERGVPLNALGQDCKSALHFAVIKDQPEIFKMLLRQKVDLELPCALSPEHHLLGNNCGPQYLDRFHAMMAEDRRRRTNRPGHSDHEPQHVFEGSTPLHVAVEKGRKEMVEMLLDQGANLSARTYSHGDRSFTWDGETPLHIAAWCGHNDICLSLLRHGAEIDAPNFNLASPLLQAIDGDQADTCRLLLDHGASLEVKNIDGHTPLEVAVSLKRKAITILLQTHGK